MSKIFGGSKSKSKQQSQSKSYNRAYDDISSNIGASSYDAYNRGIAAINSELDGGFDAYKANSGFDFMKLLGLQREAGAASGQGVFNSGATLKGLAEYESGLNNSFYQQYLNNLFQRAGVGQSGIGLLGSTGGVSTASSSGYSTSKSSPGFGSFLGAGLSAFAGG